MIPVNAASPCCLIVTPIPDPTPISRPVECNKESPRRIVDPGEVPIPAGATLVKDIVYGGFAELNETARVIAI